jgi:hypothetical protein
VTEPRNPRPFAKVPESLILDFKGDGSPLRLFAWMACKYANGRGECWASRERLASDLSITVRSVDRALTALVALGALTKRQRKRPNGSTTSACYILAGVARVGPQVDNFVYLPDDEVDKSVREKWTEKSPPEPDPLEPEGAKAPSARGSKKKDDGRRPISEQDVSELIEKWNERYGSYEAVQAVIDDALNHQARRRCLNERLYVDGWLRRELERRPEPFAKRDSSGGSRFGPPEGSPGMSATHSVRETEFYRAVRGL